MAEQESGSYLTPEHIDRAIEILREPTGVINYVLLLGHYENLLKYGIKDAFMNPVTGELVIVAKDKEDK